MALFDNLMPHQVAIRDFIADRPGAGIFVKVGFSKTYATLAGLFKARPAGHMLLIAPKNIARSTWLDEIDKWGIPVRTISLIVDENDRMLTRKKRLALYAGIPAEKPTLYMINQDLVKDLVASMPVVKTAVGRYPSGGIKYESTVQWPFPTVIIDESQGFKNGQSVRFKSLAAVRPQITRMIEMSGTPTPQGPIDLWAQVYLLDQGQALGTKFVDFRDRYFKPVLFKDSQPIKWEILPGAEEEIYRRISHLVMSVDNNTMPVQEPVPQYIKVRMPKDVAEAYADFKREAVLEFVPPGTTRSEAMSIIAANAAVLRAKLLQFASGTMYMPVFDENGDPIPPDPSMDVTDDGRPYAVVHSEKIEMLDWAIRNAKGSVLVCYRFKSDKVEITKQLEALGHQVATFDGSRAMVKAWNDRQVPVMLLQPASAGHGLNLQHGGSDIVWYTLPESLEHWIQANGRLARNGQTENVDIAVLLTEGTVDMKLPVALDDKAQTQENLLEAVLLEVEEVLEEVSDVIGDLDLYPL